METSDDVEDQVMPKSQMISRSFRGANQCFAKKRGKLCVDMPIVCGTTGSRHVIRVLSSTCPGFVLVTELAAAQLICCGQQVTGGNWHTVYA